MKEVTWMKQCRHPWGDRKRA